MSVKVGDKYWKYKEQRKENRTLCYISHIIDEDVVRVNDEPDYSGFSNSCLLKDLVPFEEKNYTTEEVTKLLKTLHGTMEAKARVDMNNECGNGYVFNVKEDAELEAFTLEKFIDKYL